MFKFEDEDEVIFSCTVIPVESNKRNREKLDAELKRKKVRLFNDVHVSGHAARKDHRDIINMLIRVSGIKHLPAATGIYNLKPATVTFYNLGGPQPQK